MTIAEKTMIVENFDKAFRDFVEALNSGTITNDIIDTMNRWSFRLNQVNWDNERIVSDFNEIYGALY